MGDLTGSGQLRHTVEFLRRSKERTEYGGLAEEWVPIGRRRAHFHQLDADETHQAGGNQTSARARVQIRHSDEFTTRHRIRFRGSDWEIVGVRDPDQMRRWTTLELRQARQPAKKEAP